MDALVVDRMTRPMVREAAAMLARSFDDDPLSRFLFPGRRRRSIGLRSFMRATVRDALAFDDVWVATDRSRVVGVAAWLPDGAYPLSPARQARQVGAALATLLTPSTVTAGARLLGETQSVHPTEPHWYLTVLGVEPSAQGHGVGGALLRPLLDRLDHDGVGAYLETSKASNVAWYERRGFALARTLEIWADGPAMWTMWREPVAQDR
jgi:ribosomal protein S18 acetylase RimI-like enzyme